MTCKGSLVSIHGLLFLRGSLRSAGGPPSAASTTSGPHPRKARLRGGGIGADLIRRKGVPHVRRGVGYVGAWPLARLTKSHRGYPPAGEALGQNLLAGPPLGAPRRRARGTRTVRSHADRALGNSEEESGCGPRRDRPVPDELRGLARPLCAGAPIS